MHAPREAFVHQAKNTQEVTAMGTTIHSNIPLNTRVKSCTNSSNPLMEARPANPTNDARPR